MLRHLWMENMVSFIVWSLCASLRWHRSNTSVMSSWYLWCMANYTGATFLIYCPAFRIKVVIQDESVCFKSCLCRRLFSGPFQNSSTAEKANRMMFESKFHFTLHEKHISTLSCSWLCRAGQAHSSPCFSSRPPGTLTPCPAACAPATTDKLLVLPSVNPDTGWIIRQYKGG